MNIYSHLTQKKTTFLHSASNSKTTHGKNSHSYRENTKKNGITRNEYGYKKGA